MIRHNTYTEIEEYTHGIQKQVCPYQYSKDRVHNTQQTSKQNGKHHNSVITNRKGVYLACLQCH